MAFDSESLFEPIVSFPSICQFSYIRGEEAYAFSPLAPGSQDRVRLPCRYPVQLSIVCTLSLERKGPYTRLQYFISKLISFLHGLVLLYTNSGRPLL